jgi:hypothetical protein
MPQREPSLRRRFLVVGAGFVCGGLLVSGLAWAFGLTPEGQEVMRAGILGGAVPVVIGLALILAGLLLRR